jgi:hypothetical protein
MLFIYAIFFVSASKLHAQSDTVVVDWSKTIIVSKTISTLQVVVNPMLKSNSPIYDGSFYSLQNLGADYVRFSTWFPYPHMAVAELRPPTKDETFWDFSHIDPLVEDFIDATKGHPVIMNFSTIPAWMFKTAKSVEVPVDPDQAFWSYNAGTQLRDSSLNELTDYYVRLFSWYTKGGFTDELGMFHKSGYYYKIPYWEVLNEPDFEHYLTPESYTRIYDAIVIALKKISTETKFIGLALSVPNNPYWFEYFLNPVNHKHGVPLEGISYHFYGMPDDDKQTIDNYQYSFFNQANGFLDKVRYIESIRKRLSPQTFTTIDEIGNILSCDGVTEPIPDDYWNLSGAMFAYIYLELSKIGIDVAGESQLVGYPSQFPSVSMMNWKNGKPNARFWALKLLKDNFEPGDKLVSTSFKKSNILCQAFITSKGKKLLLINLRNKEMQINLPTEAKDALSEYVDITTGENPSVQTRLAGTAIVLKPFSIIVVQLN